MVKLYIGNHKLYISADDDLIVPDHVTRLPTEEVDSEKTLMKIINKMYFKRKQQTQWLQWKSKTPVMEALTSNLKELKKEIAGGGVVLNNKNQVLSIFRKGKWDIPKGKIEGKEDIYNAALREVKEETAITNLILGSHAYTTFHVYKKKKELYLKRSEWFFMYGSGKKLKPEKGEGIQKAEWRDPEFFIDPKTVAYQSIRDLIRNLIIQAR